MSDRKKNAAGQMAKAIARPDTAAPAVHIAEMDRSKHFICGGGAQIVNILITFPINKVMFRQQLYGFRTHKALRQLWGEGPLNLYRGIIPPLFQKSTSTALMFGLFNHSKDFLVKDCQMNPFTATLVASMVAGSCEATLVPFERIQTLLLDPKHHNTFKNSYHAFTSLHSNYGFSEYFRGVTAVLLRNGPSNVIFFTLRRPLKQLLPEADKNTFHNSFNDFVSGAVIGGLCSTIFFPVNVVKTRMQSCLGGKFYSFSSTFTLVFQERNRLWRKMYRGSHVNLARSFLSWGIINASYEILMQTFFVNR
uniref:Solute carrier family 25 member 51 n=1 Tax=Phallusia mammillata TaxID=59560 RepID=A0A6F9DT81_9ASCI|nr:solute carrier family 25 member 51 [Phallusia mammillata]